jgi:copper(I)-binding protein
MPPEPFPPSSLRLPRRSLPGLACAIALALACSVPSRAAGEAVATGPASAAGQGAVTVEQAWSRATVPGMTVGVGYLTLVNRGRVADALLGASSPVAARVEIHSSTMDGGTMQMRQLQRVDLAPGQVVRFGPGGLHLMLVGLERALVAGGSVPLQLRFAVAGEQRVLLRVEPLDYSPPR